MRSDGAALAAAERRLHPLSWLFQLLAQLRSYALPLIALLLFGRRGGAEWWESFGAIGALLLALHSVLLYFSYRFRIADGELTIRSGVLSRTVRHIPLARVQNVSLKRTLLHRLAGVAEVRLESAAGGGDAEAEMRVLSLADAAALEEIVRASRAAPGGAEAATAGPEAEPLLRLPLSELLRLGLASNRGMVVVAAGFGALVQLQPDSIGRLRADGIGRQIWSGAESAFGLVGSAVAGPLALAVAFALLTLAGFGALRLLSVALVLLRLYDFRLIERDDRFSVEGGLLTRLRGHAARHKVQRWLLGENLLLRAMGRRSLRIETAAGRALDESHSLSELVPIAPSAQLDALLRRWLPTLDWPAIDWQPLHRKAWRRFLMPPLLGLAASTLLLALNLGALALFTALLVPIAVLYAVQVARWSAWAVDGRHVLWRSGWLGRHWQIAEITRLQLVRVEQSPFDRRHGMASLLLDTAGAGQQHPALRLRHIPAGIARELARQLAQRIARV